MHNLTPEIVLMYYEYPQVFLGRNPVDQSFCCMAVEETEDGPRYLCTPISNERRESLASGRIDLRSVYAQPEVDDFFISDSGASEAGVVSLIQADFSACPEGMLPKPGLTFDGYDEVAQKAVELNATVSYASLSVPEAERQLRIRSVTLAQFLTHYQGAVRTLSKRIAKELKLSVPKDTNPFGVDVFGYSQGSFTIHFRSSSDGDLFGDNHIQMLALEWLGRFLQNTENPELAFEMLRSQKGHSAAALIRLLGFIQENQAPLKLRWATPRCPESKSAITNSAGVRGLVEMCRQREDLAEEEVVLVGFVSAANIDGNTWKITNEEDGQQHRGGVAEESGISMAGIVIDLKRYKFLCKERTEVNPGTGRETTHLSVYKIEEM